MRRNFVWTFMAMGMVAVPVAGQEASLEAGLRVARLVAEPAEVTVEVGGSASLVVRALDAAGNPVDAQIRVRGNGVSYDGTTITATRGGQASLVASVVLPADAAQQPAQLVVPITVTWPPVATIDLTRLGDETLYAGTTVRYAAEAFFANGARHVDPSFSWSSSDPSVATVDARGNVTARSAGPVTISAVA